MSISKAWDTLETIGISEQTLQIVTSINGYSLDTLENILYAVTGYRSFEQSAMIIALYEHGGLI